MVADVVRDVVGRVAPTVAGALGGAPAARIVREVSQALTGRPDATADALRASVEDLTEPQVAALTTLEAEYTERLRIAAQDRADAREMHEKTDSRSPNVLLASVGLAFVGMLVLLVFFEPPAGSESIVFGGVGTLGAAFIACVNFTVGSSIDSRRKTGMMMGRPRE